MVRVGQRCGIWREGYPRAPGTSSSAPHSSSPDPSGESRSSGISQDRSRCCASDVFLMQEDVADTLAVYTKSDKLTNVIHSVWFLHASER